MNRHARSKTMIFTIDIDNNITAHESEAQAEDATKLAAGTTVVRSEKKRERAAAEWPISRLVETWNGFAGAPPFGDLKPVKKLENRQVAVPRIWGAIQKLAEAAQE